MQRTRFTSHLQGCPICGSKQGKCATTDDGAGVICWTRANAVSGTVEGQWTCTKTSADTDAGMGSIWFPTDQVHARSPYERLVAINNRPPEAEPVPLAVVTEAPEPEQHSIPVDERHQRHSALLERFKAEQSFQVTADHAKAMAARLYSPNWESVQRWMTEEGFWSVRTRNQRIPLEAPIPGAYAKGKAWELRPAVGLYAPLKDVKGRLLGWELRRDNPKRDQGRYAVNSSDACPLELAESKEQPISWCPPPGKPVPESGWNLVLLVEGKGIKPMVVAKAYGLPVLGCGGSMGGASSRTQLLDACDELAPGGRLILFSDSGWLINDRIALAMAKTVSVLRQEGHQPLIASAEPWRKEGGKSSRVKKSRMGSDGTVFEGSDPDELDPNTFWQCINNPLTAEAWAENERTPDSVREAIVKGLSYAAELNNRDDHIRRQSGVNRRARHSMKPRLKNTAIEPVACKPDELIPATLSAIKRNQKAEAQRFKAWADERFPELKAVVSQIDSYGPTHTFWDDPARLEEVLRLGITAQEMAGRLKKSDWLADVTDLNSVEAALKYELAEDHPLREELKNHRHKEQIKAARRWAYEPLPQLIINRSGTGSGKTHSIAQAEASRLLWSTAGSARSGGIIYLSTNYRSPQVEALEQWKEIPSRHGGLITVVTPETKQPRLIRAAENSEEPLTVEPTCAYAFRFNQLIERGHDQEITNKWCSRLCPHRPKKFEKDASGRTVNVGGDDSCAFPKEMGRLVDEVCRPKSTRREEVQRLRTSTDGLLGLASYGEGHLKQSVVVLDETDQLDSALKQTITLHKRDISRLHEQLDQWFSEGQDRTLAARLICAIEHLLDQKPGGGIDHGLSPAECREHPRVLAAQQAIAQAYLTEDGGVRLPEAWRLPQRTDRAVIGALFAKQAEEQSRKLTDVPMPVLPDLLRAVMPKLMGAQDVTISVDKGSTGKGVERVLTLERWRPEFAKAVAKAATVLVMDATVIPEDVLAQLHLNPKGEASAAHVQVIEAEARPETEKGRASAEVLMRQVPCLGGMGRRRSPEKVAERNLFVDAWVQHMAARGLGRVGVIDHKPFCRAEHEWEQPWLTVSARGGNYFAEAQALLLVGLPVVNVNAAARQAELTYGVGAGDTTSSVFYEHQQNAVAAELVQARGRLREGRRASEVLELWLLTDANLTAICDQKGWPRTLPVRASDITGKVELPTAEAQAWDAVEMLVRTYVEAAQAPPSGMKGACEEAGVALITWRRAAKARGLSYAQLVKRMQKQTA